MASDTISFARGAPSADILPVDAVREATAKALESDWERALSYGTGIGHPGLCEWVAREFHGLEAEQVMFTNGSMEAAALLFRYMVEPGDRVIVEQPSYDRTLLLLGRTGAELTGVPLEADGLDIEAFERALAAGPVKLVHVIPNFHNPAGCTLSAAKRERLVELAAEHDFWIFEDDPYRLVEVRRLRAAADDALDGHRGPRDPRLLVLEDGQPRRPRRLPRRAPRTRSGRSPSAARSTTSRRTCSPSRWCSSSARRAHWRANIEFVNGALAERRDALVEALREQLPEAEFVVPGGGYFLWLDLAADVDSPALLEQAKREGVAFVAGPDFMLEGGRSSLRLSFASVPAERVAEGVARIAARAPIAARRDPRLSRSRSPVGGRLRDEPSLLN